MFKLQQFSIAQDQCAMKVCTDSLIFGANAPIAPNDAVLDIGTGTGILSLMCCQLGANHVVTVELDPMAAAQAQDNVRLSRWSQRIEVLNLDIINYQSEPKFDVVISNPPFFDNHLTGDNKQRNTARHTDSLSYATLLSSCAQHVTDSGTVSLLLPLHCVDSVVAFGKSVGLYLKSQLDYQPNPSKPAKVCQLIFTKTINPNINRTNITIYDDTGQYTAHSQQLLEKFLLRFATTP